MNILDKGPGVAAQFVDHHKLSPVDGQLAIEQNIMGAIEDQWYGGIGIDGQLEEREIEKVIIGER